MHDIKYMNECVYFQRLISAAQLPNLLKFSAFINKFQLTFSPSKMVISMPTYLTVVCMSAHNDCPKDWTQSVELWVGASPFVVDRKTKLRLLPRKKRISENSSDINTSRCNWPKKSHRCLPHPIDLQVTKPTVQLWRHTRRINECANARPALLDLLSGSELSQTQVSQPSRSPVWSW